MLVFERINFPDLIEKGVTISAEHSRIIFSFGAIERVSKILELSSYEGLKLTTSLLFKGQV